MAKTYLNNEDRNDLLKLTSFLDFLEKHSQKMSSFKNVPKDILKFLKMSKSFGYKVLDYYMKDLNEDYKLDLIKKLKSLELIIKSKTEAIKELQKMTEFNKITHIDTEDFNLIVEHSLIICMKCNMDPSNISKCELRKVFMKQDIAPFNLEATETQCQYCPDEKQNSKDWFETNIGFSKNLNN